MTVFGHLKIDNSGDTMMSSDAIYHADNFGRLSLPVISIWTVILPFLVPSKQIEKH